MLRLLGFVDRLAADEIRPYCVHEPVRALSFLRGPRGGRIRRAMIRLGRLSRRVFAQGRSSFSRGAKACADPARARSESRNCRAGTQHVEGSLSMPSRSASRNGALRFRNMGRPNPELIAALQCMGATVVPFAIYRWVLPADVETVARSRAPVSPGVRSMLCFSHHRSSSIISL